MNDKNERDELLKRVIEAKSKLPAYGVTSLFILSYPEYSEKTKKALLNNCLQLRTANEEITEMLEKLVAKLKS